MADNYDVKNAIGSVVTMKSKDVGAGVECVQNIVSDTTGVELIGQKVAAASLPVVPASDYVAKIKPGAAAATIILNLTTAATGANYTQFASQACSSLTIINSRVGAVPLEIRNSAAPTNAMQLAVGSSIMFLCSANANEWEVRRQDTVSTQVVITALVN